ncbi:MAG TPA: SdiA-regulated domain-containing protein [Burkholderiales bacterium]|nr:SdiA-regulated domain-containing protein [Burkholderiales bacterium]
MIQKILVAALAALGAATAAAGPFSLANYKVTGSIALDRLAGLGPGVSGLEASAVTYARDRGTLFYVGDEGTGVVEISRTGQTVSTMAFSAWPAASTNHDSEGLTYLGGGVLVVMEERLQDAFRFNYVAGGSVNLANADFVSISNVVVGNNGIEGISFDPRNGGSFVTVKQQLPQNVLGGTLTFAAPPAGGTSTMAPLFDPALLGLATLSDVQTLAVVDDLVGTPQADNLLILSLGSNLLVEATRSGSVVSSFNLNGIVPHNAIEGVTIDEHGTIYLVAEQEQDGSVPADQAHSRLIVLSQVPVPGTLALTLGGLGMLGWRARRSD